MEVDNLQDNLKDETTRGVIKHISPAANNKTTKTVTNDSKK